MSRIFDADVIVIGGGISGLACAWNLQQQGSRVLVLEAAAEAGGAIGSRRVHGCLLEAGPNSALDTTPLIGNLLEELGITGERISASPAARNRYILRDGKLVALPLSPLAFLRSPLFSARAKLRLLAEPFIAASEHPADESVAAFVRRRLGNEFLDYAINPFVGGVYAGDPELLGLKAAFPRLHDVEQKHGSLIRGYVAGIGLRRRNIEQSKRTAPMFTFREGMQTLPAAIACRLAQVQVSTSAVQVTPAADGFTVTAKSGAGCQALYARAVVVATPAYAAAPLVESFAQEAGRALRAIEYPPVTVAISAFPQVEVKDALDGFGVLVPQRERRKILGALFSSSLFVNRAPAGMALITTFIGGMRQPEMARLSDAELSATVQSELEALLGVPPRAHFMEIKRWERAIPQYAPAHLARIAKIELAERQFPGLFLRANYRGGVAIGDCIKSAEKTARELDAFLQSSR